MNPFLAVLCAPSNLGLMPPEEGREPGVRRMPEALVAHGLVSRLGVNRVETVPPPPYSFALDGAVGIRNAQAIRAYTAQLATTVERTIETGFFPLVLGGDCSILLGAMLGLRRVGDYGLVFIDGHRDFQTPQTSATGGAAGMDLALATGRGPAILTRFEEYESLVREEATVVLAHRDERAGEPDASRAIETTAITRLDLAAVRRVGLPGAAFEALSVLRTSGAEGFWLHIDADVLASDAMPAVDSPQPGGLSYAELHALVVPLLRSDLAVGMEVTIYDPERDPTDEVGLAFTAFLARMLNDAGYAG